MTRPCVAKLSVNATPVIGIGWGLVIVIVRSAVPLTCTDDGLNDLAMLGIVLATVSVALAAAPGANSFDVSVLVVLSWAPPVVARTVTTIWQDELAASVPPLSET